MPTIWLGLALKSLWSTVSPLLPWKPVFANAGQVSPGYASPWAAPGVPLKAIKWLLQRHAPLAIKATADIDQYLWMAQMLRNCTASRYAVNKERMVRLSEYSRDCLDELRAETGICLRRSQPGDYSTVPHSGPVGWRRQRHRGTERIRRALRTARPRRHCPRRAGPGQCHRYPCQVPCACRTTRLATARCSPPAWPRCASSSASSSALNRTSSASTAPVDRINGVWIDGKLETADRYVLALGSYSPKLLKPLGIKAPVYPLKGYSLTVPITNPAMAPTSTILDETYKVAITRFDNRIRVGGMAEIAGFDLSLNPRRRETLEMIVNDLYPQGGDLAKRQFWTGLRPTTPGRHTDCRCHPVQEPVPEHRPRHPRLDHGLRFRPFAG